MKKQIILISTIIFIVLSSQIYSQRANSNSTNQVELEIILKKCAEYCKKLEHSSLYFVCIEEIKERLYYFHRPTSIVMRRTGFYSENTYIYDYQLIRKDNKITERRDLIEENGKKKDEKDAPLKTKMFEHKYVVFGPIGLLSENWQKHHNYRILKEENVKGERTIVLEAVPRSDQGLEHLFGKIWVRKNDFSILKIEWNQKSMRNFEKIEEVAKELGAEPHITFISEYTFEKNGIRFPSKYFVKEEYSRPYRRKFKRSETTVTYRDYKYFTVETDVLYKKIPHNF